LLFRFLTGIVLDVLLPAAANGTGSADPAPSVNSPLEDSP
jgi:hypothetical protein